MKGLLAEHLYNASKSMVAFPFMIRFQFLIDNFLALRWDRGLFACSTISPYFTISLQLEIRGHGNIKKGKIEVFWE